MYRTGGLALAIVVAAVAAAPLAESREIVECEGKTSGDGKWPPFCCDLVVHTTAGDVIVRQEKCLVWHLEDLFERRY